MKVELQALLFQLLQVVELQLISGKDLMMVVLTMLLYLVQLIQLIQLQLLSMQMMLMIGIVA